MCIGQTRLKLFPDAELLCALLWCKYMWKLIFNQRCSLSTALAMLIFAFSILSPCICVMDKEEKILKLFPDAEHLCALLWCTFMWKLIVCRKFSGVHPRQLLCWFSHSPYWVGPCICVLDKAEKKILNYFQMLNTSVLFFRVSTCGNSLCAENSEVFTLHSSSYADFPILHTESLYMCIGQAKNFFYLFPDAEHLCGLLRCK